MGTGDRVWSGHAQVALSRPLAVLVAGAPGSGKSSVGSLIAREVGAALLDLDTATASLTEVIMGLHGSDDLDDPALARLTRAARYETITCLAEDNLAAGISVVLVAPYTTERRDPRAWEAVHRRMHQAGASATSLVWLRISAADVRRRVERRAASRDTAKLGSDWLATLDLDPPAVPHIEVDALLSPPLIAERVLASLPRPPGT